MKTVKMSLLAVVVATAVCPSAFAGDTIEAATTEQTQTDRDAAQDTAIQNAQTTANKAVTTADEAHQAITSVQTEIDANKAAIHKNTNNITEQNNILRAQQEQITDTQKTVAATGDVQNAARYQSMVNARQEAADNAQQQQAEAQQTQITEQQKQIEATQKTVAATGDVQTAARYQGMVNAKLAAENEASMRASAEQGQKIDALSSTMTTVSQSVATENHTKDLEEIHGDITKTNTAVSKLAAQQQIDSVHYGEQIQNLVQDSTDTHQQLSNTQKRVADNSQQINTLNNHFSSLKNEVEDNRKDANAGIASAIAIASQPQVKTGDLMMVSAGAGTFNGESAVSVGTSFNAGVHTVIKAGVSADTQSDFGAGVGVGYSF
ncbi:YadA-like family protein [Escherichia coli]|nr:YadA-like family protein [Escherichia coli]